MAAPDNQRIAILATDGFEEAELTAPARALKDSGAKVDVIAPKSGQIQALLAPATGRDVISA